jgi:hypothetical protein
MQLKKCAATTYTKRDDINLIFRCLLFCGFPISRQMFVTNFESIFVYAFETVSVYYEGVCVCV